MKNILLILAMLVCVSCSSSDEPKHGTGTTGKGYDPGKITIIPQVGHSLGEIRQTDQVVAVLDRTGRYAATFVKENAPVKIWDTETGFLLRSFHESQLPRMVRFSPDSKYLLVGGDGILLYDIAHAKMLWSKKLDVFDCGFCPDGKAVWSDQWLHADEMYTLSGDEIPYLQRSEYKKHLDKKRSSFSTGSIRVQLNRSNSATVTDKEGKVIRELKVSSSPPRFIYSNPSRSRFATVSPESPQGPTHIFVYNADSFKMIGEIKGNGDPLFPYYPGSYFYLDGNMYSMEDGTSTNNIGKLIVEYGIPLAVAKQGYVARGKGFSLNYVSADTGVAVPFMGAAHPVKSYAVASAGDRAAIADGTRTVFLLDLRNGGEVHALEAPKDMARVGFTENAITASGDGVICEWDATTLERTRLLAGEIEPVNDMPPHSRFAKQPDGGLAIMSEDGVTTLATFYSGPGWHILITPDGFFDGDGDLADNVALVDEQLKAYSIKSFYVMFNRPQLVWDALNGKRSWVESMDQAAAKPAPAIRITSPERGKSIGSSTIPFEAEFTDAGGGVGDIYVYVNNILAGYWASTGKDRRVGKDISLAQGENTIEVVAYNANNSLASGGKKIAVYAHYKEYKPTLYVLAIGIDKYKKSGIDLKYCAGDAAFLVDVLSKQSAALFKDIRAHLLTSRQETRRGAIVDAISDIAGAAAPYDYFLLYISSHGVLTDPAGMTPKYYMLTSDFSSISGDALRNDAISQDDLASLLGAIPPLNKIVILDTCHAGQAGKLLEQALSGTEKAEVRASMGKLGISTGVTIFAASQSSQEAIEGYRGHGLFTYTLVEGLKGRADQDGDQKVTIAELKDYVETRVNTRSHRHFGREQIPFISGTNLKSEISEQ